MAGLVEVKVIFIQWEQTYLFPSVYACKPKPYKPKFSPQSVGGIGPHLRQFRNDVDTEFEKKAFQVCDKDGDGALDWQEVENCEVNKRHF